jgi:hypothetical protein
MYLLVGVRLTINFDLQKSNKKSIDEEDSNKIKKTKKDEIIPLRAKRAGK